MVQNSSHDFSAHPLVEYLVAWFTQNGGQLNGDVQIVFSDSRGFHMRVVKPFSSPVVASCPLKLTLSCLNLDPNQEEVLVVDSPLQQCRGEIPDHILTYLLLIEQRKRGNESPWHAYIACLPMPESMNTPLWFDNDDMVFLAGTSLAPAAKEKKGELHQHWEHALTVMKERGIALADGIDFTSDLLLWAATIFTSRAFISTHILPERETIPILFPVIDIPNHSVSAKVEWDFQPRLSFALKCLEGASLHPGQELFNNYAPKQNDELLLGYGFCLEDNPIEQFALKLAFSPQLQQYAQELGLLNAENVPFGMSSEFLNTDPNKEQHFLRARHHPFGRYDNHVPFFRGIPPYIVHFFFIQSVIVLELDLNNINIERPGARITLQVLVLLHQALEQRCTTLPLHIDQDPKNEKQKYAKIYRNGQARIIHSVRQELQAAIARLRAPDDAPPSRSLHSIKHILATFLTGFPAPAKRFTDALSKHGLDINAPESENLIWTLLLVVLASTMVTTGGESDNRTYALLRGLFETHALPALEDGIEDVDTYTFVDENLGEFLYLPSSDADASPVDVLDDIGLTFVHQPVESSVPAFISGRTENLGARIIMWAIKVAEQEVVPVSEDGVVGKLLYAREWREGEEWGDEVWMYEDVVM
ncbi:SET domain-containing protein [Decorospora gaudefroyi]|uniref:SET domain-containing protein n=1 Tax=Decorospora gaudefroyi TaxID=184978 RepID=A0A6A5K2X5_9PLEO|nr:SET domain-containing protein [Decorospora gaudefroyi]